MGRELWVKTFRHFGAMLDLDEGVNYGVNKASRLYKTISDSGTKSHCEGNEEQSNSEVVNVT